MQSSPSSSYGIHALKSLFILGSTLVHAYVWLVFSYGGSVFAVPFALGVSLGGMTLAIPMTAAAMLALRSPAAGFRDQAKDKQKVFFDWYQSLTALFFLALLESLKAAVVYGKDLFFSWDVLQNIALTAALILFVGRRSVRLLGMMGLAFLLLTPYLIAILQPYEYAVFHRAARGDDWPLAPIGHLVVLWAIFCLIAFGIVARARMERKFRIRSLLALALVWLLLSVPFLRESTPPLASLLIRSLPIGILVGTGGGILHIWGLFPWSGVSILGYLIYRRVRETKGSPACVISVFALGLALLFYVFFFHEAPGLNEKTFLNADLMNRNAILPYGVIGFFCLSVPLAIWVERTGFGRIYLQRLSRSILWVYLYQTCPMVFLYRWIKGNYGYWPGAWLIGLPMIFGSLLIPVFVTRWPTHLRLRLRRSPSGRQNGFV